MEKSQSYYDYSIPYRSNKSDLINLCDELYKLGYRTIAIEEVCDYDLLNQKSNNSRGRKSDEGLFPEPSDIKWLKKEFEDKLRILQRLTIIYRDAKIANSMLYSLSLMKYDILAARPLSDEALQFACSTMDCDLISYDLQDSEGPIICRKHYLPAYQRNMIFEIKYAPMFQSEACRRNTIKFAYILGSRDNKKPKIIISSGALDPFNLRSPTDIKFMANIFGLSESEGKRTICQTGLQLFLQSGSRRLGKTHMFTTFTGPLKIISNKEEEQQVLMNAEYNKQKEFFEDELLKEFILGRPKKKKNKQKKNIKIIKNLPPAKTKSNASKAKTSDNENLKIESLQPPVKKIKVK